MEQKYQKLNNLTGLLTFFIAACVYLINMEPTASFWDCGEYIACSYKLEVGHPPGAPFFILIGRIASLFAFGDTSKVAMMINAVSALCSAGTILFLFWSITYFAKKITLRGNSSLSDGKMYAILGSGLVGALAYTFSESFWFSAVEGEVYAMSAFFTAVIFWAVLKWEQVADEPHSDRWIILIFFLLGLSIGVHLLGILVIPVLGYVYYFKKHQPSVKGFIVTGIISIALLGIVQSIIIPGIVSLSAKFELFFVNSLGMPFNSGTVIYFLLIIGTIIWALDYTKKKKKIIWNTAVLCFTTLLIGYASFFVLVIRSQSNPPIDENNPENPISLLSYLKREQYGDWPILYGQYYNAPLFYGKDFDPEAEPLTSVDANDETPHYSDASPLYVKDEKAGKYVIADDRKDAVPNYDKRFCTFLPRMWSQQGSHVRAYQAWANIKGTPVKYRNPNNGEYETLVKPTFAENLSYFFKYQVGHMFLRYFLWNYAGRQNDIQGHGIEMSSRIEGNWISGIPFLDEIRLGSQEKLPESVHRSKANNKFFLLPLILGLIGLYFHYQSNKQSWWVVILLFLLAGLAIVIYLNPYPFQPRERDYAYAGSTYAFAIWIGLGVMAVAEFLEKKIKKEKINAIVATLVCLLAVPILMAAQGWNDHNRSRRYTCRDFAGDYLNSCAQNAILFTNGDNDTFPLWYAQEVEGLRTDVRVVNLSLANTDWYVDQLRRQQYLSAPIPLTLDQSKYAAGNRDFVPVRPREELKNTFTDLKELMQLVGSEDARAKISWGASNINYLPTTRMKLKVDSLNYIKSIPQAAHIAQEETGDSISQAMAKAQASNKILSEIEWDLGKKSYIMKSDLLILDILASSNWTRPIYFAVTVGPEVFNGLEKYFQIEGLTYRLVPYTPQREPRVNTDIMYDNLMNKAKWGGLDKNEVWMDENNLRMASTMRMQMRTLAMSLIQEGKKKKALEVLRKCMEVLPEKNVPFYAPCPISYTYYLTQTFYLADGKEEAIKLSNRLFEILEGETEYVLSVRKTEPNVMQSYLDERLELMQQLISDAHRFKAEEVAKNYEARFKKYESMVVQAQMPLPSLMK